MIIIINYNLLPLNCKFAGSTSTWVEMSVLPSMITSSPSTTPYLVANGIEAGDVALTLTGISVPKFISNSIFLFGNRLLVR